MPKYQPLFKGMHNRSRINYHECVYCGEIYEYVHGESLLLFHSFECQHKQRLEKTRVTHTKYRNKNREKLRAAGREYVRNRPPGIYNGKVVKGYYFIKCIVCGEYKEIDGLNKGDTKTCSSKCSKRWEAIMSNSHKKKYCTTLADSYIKTQIAKANIKRADIPDGMISLQRKIIMAHRLIKSIKEKTNEIRNVG